MFRVGFTGTRKGMTGRQLDRVRQLLTWLRPDAVHHGCAIGADAEFDTIAYQLQKQDRRLPRGYFRIGHPCMLTDQHAPAIVHGVDNLLPAKPPLERNQDIVAIADVMIACPAEFGEVLRSGTWATIRYVRKHAPPYKLVIVFPNGVVEFD